MEHINLFSFLIFLSCILFFQTYYLISSVLANKLFFGSVVIVFVTLFLVYSWILFPSFLGYPFKTNSLPNKFKLIHYIEVPKEKKLLIWLREEDKNDEERPRVYETHSNEDLKKNLRKAIKEGTTDYIFVKKIVKNAKALDTEKYDLILEVRPLYMPEFK